MTGQAPDDWLCAIEPWPGLPNSPDACTRRVQRGEWVLARNGDWDRMPDSPSPEWITAHAFTLGEAIVLDLPAREFQILPGAGDVEL